MIIKLNRHLTKTSAEETEKNNLLSTIIGTVSSLFSLKE